MASGVAAPQHRGGAEPEGNECSWVHMQSGERVEFSQNWSRKNRFSSWICKSKALKVCEASGSLGLMHGEWALERNRGTLFCSGWSLGPDREGGGNWLQRRVRNFYGGVEENRVHYLDVSGLIPENGNKDKKVHVSIYCFVLLCVLMWPEAKGEKCFWSSLKKKNPFVSVQPSSICKDRELSSHRLEWEG